MDAYIYGFLLFYFFLFLCISNYSFKKEKADILVKKKEIMKISKKYII